MKTKMVCTLSSPGGDCGGGSTCTDGGCPTIYETDRDSFLVQGYKVSNDDRGEISLPNGEEIIEVPRSLVDLLIKSFTK